MALVDFSHQLRAARSVLDLARLLGEACLEKADELGDMQLDEQTGKDLEWIELAAAAVSPAEWEAAIEDHSAWERHIGADLAAAIKRAKARQPLDFLGVLRGLCRRPLAAVYRSNGDQIELNRGLPVPFATRPLDFEATTKQTRLNKSGLLFPHPYSLYRFSARESVRVVLDFRHRERIDELTWSPEEGLPRIATIHPVSGGKVAYSEKGDRFFDVTPKQWDLDSVLALLASVRDEATIAVLPELSLPTPGALEAALGEDAEAYPPIVVAGSAHCRTKLGGNEIRCNESRVYLDGKCVAIARKHHPFEETKTLGGETLTEPLTEDLTKEQKTVMVLSGNRTRMAVAICADMLDLEIPQLLVAAGVNLLAVPAMTRKVGSFGSSVRNVAGFCQGVGVVVNARLREDGKPFLCYAAVPRPEPAIQGEAITADGADPPPLIGIFNPNEPLPGAVKWR